MPCWDARQHISDYLNGDLDPATAPLIEAHLEDCPTCPPLYAALVGVHDHLGRLRDSDSVIDPGVEAQIRSHLAATRDVRSVSDAVPVPAHRSSSASTDDP